MSVGAFLLLHCLNVRVKAPAAKGRDPSPERIITDKHERDLAPAARQNAHVATPD